MAQLEFSCGVVIPVSVLDMVLATVSIGWEGESWMSYMVVLAMSVTVLVVMQKYAALSMYPMGRDKWKRKS